MPEAIKTQLKVLCVDLADAKWVSHSQMHLTLRFIGDTDSTQQEHLQTGLTSIHVTPFKMRLQGIGQFPPRGKPRIIWVGIEADSGLYDLQKQIEAVIRTIGFEPTNHAFSPHITLARLKIPPSQTNLQHYFDEHRTFKTDAFDVERFILYSSQLTASGSIYRQEGVFKLT